MLSFSEYCRFVEENETHVTGDYTPAEFAAKFRQPLPTYEPDEVPPTKEGDRKNRFKALWPYLKGTKEDKNRLLNNDKKNQYSSSSSSSSVK